MGTVERAQQFFADAEVLVTVTNTYRPELNGTRRKITRKGKSFFDAVMLDGEQAGKDCRGVVPTKAGDVLDLTDDTITLRLGKRYGHTVTYRKEA